MACKRVLLTIGALVSFNHIIAVAASSSADTQLSEEVNDMEAVEWKREWNQPTAGDPHCTQRRLEFIHIGKCGGTFLSQWLPENNFSSWCVHETHCSHIDPTKTNINQVEMFIVWVRDPIRRYRSAFEYECAVARHNVSSMVAENGLGHIESCKMGPNCLAPVTHYNQALAFRRMMRKANETGLPPQPDSYYRTLLKHRSLCNEFESPNGLAESLSLPLDSERGTNARRMMLSLMHLRWGIGRYLDDGDFVAKHHRKIFLGRLENQHDDLIRLENTLKLKTAADPTNKNGGSNGMHKPSYHIEFSDKAERNLRAYYAGDFKALIALEKHGLLSKKAAAEYKLAPVSEHDERMVLDDGLHYMEYENRRSMWSSTLIE